MNSKRWCFTLNNPDDDAEAFLLRQEYKYLVFGREVGALLTPHLQGFITFAKNKRLAGVRKLLPSAHWEVAKGSSTQAADYCKKDGDFEERGEVPTQGKRSDLSEAIATLKEEGLGAVTEKYPEVFVKYSRGLKELALYQCKPYTHDTVRGIWIHGPPASGKSHWARANYARIYDKAQNKWFDGYDGEDCILLDDLDTDVLGHHLKIWSDKYACTGETKGGTVNLTHKVFCVTSNYHPSDLFHDPMMYAAIERRFYIVEKATRDTEIKF